MIIYKTTNLINGKIYIGKDVKNKKSYLGSGTILKKAIEKHGKENFLKEIIEYCKNNDELCKREIYWIKKLNSTNKNIGYNISKGGNGGVFGKIQSKKTRIKKSNSLKNRVFSQKHKERISNALKGVSKSDIHKEKVKESLKKIYLEGFVSPSKGKKHTLEFKENISKIMQGKKRANKITIVNGVTYNSQKEASEKTGLSLFKVAKLSKDEKNNKKQSIEINGVKYESLTEASKKTGLSLFLINKIKNDILGR